VNRIIFLSAACAATVWLGGCAATKPAPVAAAETGGSTSMQLMTGARDVAVFAGSGGQGAAPANWGQVLRACSAADVVIIGEQHGHPLGLMVAAALFEDVLALAQTASLSMEFFERDEQSRVDDYLTGVTDEATFRRRTGRTDSNYPEGHRAMVEAAREAKRPVHAANAPRAIVRLARRDGYDALFALTQEQRRLFRVPDALPEADNPYRLEFESLMRDSLAHAHGGGGGGGAEGEDPDATERMVAAMLRAQSLWDWTMAHSVARAVSAGDVPVVHVVGRFHSDFGGGLVQSLEQLSPGLRIVTISMSDRWSDHLRADDENRAAFVVYVGPR
jgi:uncharacterized iron-regulated protein